MVVDEEESVVKSVVMAEVEVGRWPACHSMVPPTPSGRLAMGVMTGGAEKATVMGSDSGAQLHGSPLVMAVGLEVCSHATLCLVISQV